MASRIRVGRAVPLFLLLAAVLSSTSASGQTTTATLQGTIRDASHSVLPGVAVTLRDQNTGFVRATTTDKAGLYMLTYVPAGTYELTTELEGFKTIKREGLRFEVGQQATLDVTMEMATLQEVVVVKGEAPLVETTKTTIDKVISREQIDTLPLAGRQASSLAMLAPGVTSRGGDPGSGGQPRGSSGMLVDGVSNELMATNTNRANAPPDAIQEFQVLTTQYAAEFGNASGLILNTITRSGTNELHGRVYYFQRSERWDEPNYFSKLQGQAIPALAQKQGGGWLGGPIVKDRTHYFFSYEATRRTTVANVNSAIEKKDVKQPFDNNQLLAKVTHQLTTSNTLTARISLDRPTAHMQGVGGIYVEEVGYDSITKDRTFVATLASILSNRALNELRIQQSREDVALLNANPNVYTVQRPSSVTGKLGTVPQAFPEVRFQFVDNLSYEAGRHRIKLGVDVNRVTLDGYVYQYNPGYFIFSTDAPFDASKPSTYPILFYENLGDPHFAYSATGASAFAQDAWHLPNNLTLNLGVRYDAWMMKGLDLQKTNFAPRLGFAWDPTGSNKTSIRGGVGTFYGTAMFNVALLATWLSTQKIVIYSSPGYPDPHTKGSATGSVLSLYESQPNEPMPRSYSSSIGAQRALFPGLSVSADYTNTRGRRLIRIVQANPLDPVTFKRRDPTKGSISLLESSGYSNYNALLLGVTGRFRRGMLGLAYTLSSDRSTSDAENSAYYQDDVTPNDSYGYSNYDQRHRLVLQGTVMLPFDFHVGAILSGRSGTPFNITTGKDNNKNGTANDRPDLAPGATIDGPDMTNRASFIDPGTRGGNLPRNAGRGSGSWTLDLRVSKRFEARGTKFELLAEAFNATNRVNFNNPVGTLSSSNFGKAIGAGAARQVQLGVRFEF